MLSRERGGGGGVTLKSCFRVTMDLPHLTLSGVRIMQKLRSSVQKVGCSQSPDGRADIQVPDANWEAILSPPTKKCNILYQTWQYIQIQWGNTVEDTEICGLCVCVGGLIILANAAHPPTPKDSATSSEVGWEWRGV